MIAPRYFQEISSLSYLSNSPKIESENNFLLLDSGSSAIRFVLEFLKEKKGHLKVGVPLYSCFSVFQSVHSSGNTIISLDINPLVEPPLNETVLSNLDVLLWIDYFGIKYNKFLLKIKEKFPSLIIIEDATHVDFTSFRGEKTTIADFAVFSFNFRKPIVAGGGGAVLCNISDFCNELNDKYGKLSTAKFSIKGVVKSFINNYSYNFFIYYFLRKIIEKKRNLNVPQYNISKKPEKISLFHNSILGHQIIRKNCYPELTENFMAYFKPDRDINYYSYLCYFPIIFKSNFERDQILTKLNKENIDAFILWDKLLLNYKSANFLIDKNLFPETFKFFDNVIFIPNSILLNNKKISLFLKYSDRK